MTWKKRLWTSRGIRIICQFVEDIYEVANMFYARDGKDLKGVKIKNYLEGEDKSLFKSGEGIPKASGYQSYHMIIKYPVFCFTGYREVYVEIQIRTLAMNFLGDHRAFLELQVQGKAARGNQTRLTNTADAVCGLDDEMPVIRDELPAQKIKMKSGTVNDPEKYQQSVQTASG